MARSIKSIILGSMLSLLIGVTSLSAEATKVVTVNHFGHHHAVVVHPYHHRHYYHWRHHHHHHHGYKHHHHHHHR